MAPALNSISPIAGPPGAAITLTGRGFDTSSQAACPVLVATVYVTPTTLTATIPEDLGGADGTSLAIGVYVRNGDGSASAALPFTVQFPTTRLQAYTTVDAVAGEVPGFLRGGKITDAQIGNWIRTTAQEINGAMLRRGLPLDPTQWQPAGNAASPDPADVLEMLNRVGAAAALAAAIGSQFGAGEYAIAKTLAGIYARMLASLKAGDYDKLFRPSAATVESEPLLAAGDTSREDGKPSTMFWKDRKF
jgi:hypothetical protein